MTIHQAYQQVLFQLFELYNDHEAANIADMLIEHVTGQRKIDRILYKTLPVSPEQQNLLDQLTTELLTGKPIQYVLHTAWFANIALYVDENVLIPRPETEELADRIIKDHRGNTLCKVLDIGTGSGCIPIALKKKFPGWDVAALDVSKGALEVARRNAIDQSAIIDFLEIDFLEQLQWKQLGIYNIIVSNPPYIKQSESALMHRNVLEYEPHTALFVADDDALIFYRAIATFAHNHLAADGNIYLEINEALGDATRYLLQQQGYEAVVIKDMQGKERMIKAWRSK